MSSNDNSSSGCGSTNATPFFRPTHTISTSATTSSFYNAALHLFRTWYLIPTNPLLASISSCKSVFRLSLLSAHASTPSHIHTVPFVGLVQLKATPMPSKRSVHCVFVQCNKQNATEEQRWSGRNTAYVRRPRYPEFGQFDFSDFSTSRTGCEASHGAGRKKSGL
jgi:hypothetical protein